MHWSILINVVNYVQYDRDPKNVHDLSIKTLDQQNHKKMYNKLTEDERQILDHDFGNNSDKFRRVYLEMYEGFQSKVLHSTRFDQSSNLGTTYLGKTDMTRATKIKA